MDRRGFASRASLDAGTASELACGRREKNKAEKLQRIRKAARALFTKQGYDDTTMRDIAKRAEIGFGTLFTYASDKRDLLFLIFNDELDNVVARALEHGLARRDLVDQLVAYFGGFYRFFAPQPELSRVVLREMTFFMKGHQAEQFQTSCDLIVQHLASLVANAHRTGQIAAQEEPSLIAQALMSTFAAEIRRWIALEEPVLEEGLGRLRRMLALQITGLSPRAGTSAGRR